MPASFNTTWKATYLTIWNTMYPFLVGSIKCLLFITHKSSQSPRIISQSIKLHFPHRVPTRHKSDYFSSHQKDSPAPAMAFRCYTRRSHAPSIICSIKNIIQIFSFHFFRYPKRASRTGRAGVGIKAKQLELYPR